MRCRPHGSALHAVPAPRQVRAGTPERSNVTTRCASATNVRGRVPRSTQTAVWGLDHEEVIARVQLAVTAVAAGRPVLDARRLGRDPKPAALPGPDPTGRGAAVSGCGSGRPPG